MTHSETQSCGACGGVCMYSGGGKIRKVHPGMENQGSDYKNDQTRNHPDYSGGQRRGPKGYPKYQEQAQYEKGINRPVSGVTGFPGAKGTSNAGNYTKDKYGGKPTFSGKDHPAIKEHHKVLSEMKSMPNPKLKGLAHGGEIGIHTSSMDIDRPHDKKEKKWAGESKAGSHSRRFADFKPSFSSKLSREEAIDSHHKVLGEMTVMPKPKLKGLAKGGEVGSHANNHAYNYDAYEDMKGVNKVLPRYEKTTNRMKYGESVPRSIEKHKKIMGELKSMPNPKLKGLSEGGMPEDAPDLDDTESSELLESCASELIDAIHSKNKKEILDSLKAIILSTKG